MILTILKMDGEIKMTTIIENTKKSKTYQYALFAVVFFPALMSQQEHISNLIGEDGNSLVMILAVALNSYAIIWNRDRTTKPIEEL